MEYATTTDPKTGKPIVEFQCPSCGAGQRAALADAGSPTSCDRCGAAFRVPGGDDAAKTSPSRRAEPPKAAPASRDPSPAAGRVSDMPPAEYRKLIREAVASGVLGGLIRWTGLVLLVAIGVTFIIAVLATIIGSD